jgi:hypothetical protein
MLLPYPFIPDRRDSGARPYWSVMIPTYNPRADYLEETLNSVLQQDPGKARSFYAELAVFHAREMLVEARFRPAWKQILFGALRLSHGRRIIWQISSFFLLWFRIIGSRLKRRLKPKANAPGHA